MNSVSPYQRCITSILLLLHEWLYNTKTQLIAFSFAFFSLVGRWNIGKLFGVTSPEEFGFHVIYELRFWSVLILFVCTFVFSSSRNSFSSSFSTKFILFFPKRTNFSRKIFIFQFFLFVYLLMTSAWMYYSDTLLIKMYEVILILLYIISIYIITTLQNCEELIDWIWFYLICIAYVIFFLSLPIMLSGMDTGTERLSVLGGGPNIFARFIAICLLHSLYHIIHNRRYLFGSILPFLLGSLVISGSRGVIVATMLMILLLFYIKKIFSLRSIIRSTFLFLFLFLGGYVILAIGIPKTFEVVQNSIEQRFYQKTLVQGSSSGRDDIWQRAYTHSWEHPFLGHGLASWKYYYEEESYPHNIFLELFYEGGLASVGIFLVMIFLTCKSCAINARNKRLRCYYICLLTMFFFASLFSGDIFDSRCVFSMMLIVSIPEKD